MTTDQWIIFGTLILTLVLFITGRWRYDVVAFSMNNFRFYFLKRKLTVNCRNEDIFKGVVVI